MEKAEIGIFGGSGFYNFAKEKREISIKTPYGTPSGKITLCKIYGKNVAFLPRHGVKHQYPPHLIPYKANIYAFKKLGVTKIIAPTAAGSLNIKVKPGDFVLCDQFIDRTWGRNDSFFQGQNSKPRFSKARVAHISFSEPYCPNLRKIAFKACKNLKYAAHPKGTVVVINGPRFSSKAESLFYQSQKWDVINMTQYPEVSLARELGMCFLNISLITDYDCGFEGNPKIKPVTTSEVLVIFKSNVERVKTLIEEIIKTTPKDLDCKCKDSLTNAVVS